MHPGSFSATLESWTASGCSPLRMLNVTCFQFDLVMMQLLLQERVMPVFDEFNSTKLNWTRTRYSFSSEKLVIFENDPLSIHWGTALKDLSKTVK